MTPDTGRADQSGAIWHPSPNFGPRRDGLTPSLIVLHYTAMDSARAALERLCDPAAEVSAHYLIGADGTLWQMVAEDSRAWHAGAGEWAGQDDINSRSIGIELDNLGTHPFSALQMAVLEDLMQGIMQRWNIPPAGVIGHSCMAPGRKFDPGPRFDWARLARQGLAADGGGAPLPQTVTFAHFRAAAATAGFTAPSDDETLLAAVRLRFRPWARGPLSAEDFLPLA
ncbi:MULTISPECIES: N-acetylmuramoyl-L-alanine amidase [unclassified Leisingera]|uniref:N-acetylmuramoyl-L-alanine amidase n=1 Tax=unclassified Leisingera TaxID=2614906 RepID=UPI00031A019D|nr:MULTISPECIES: N-acetylmuramoyl-L-alanine amidase [unclassified Leisingera]KIC25750.1 N-acetylmuramoyl-L-alanine amidase [Leisingera sp. ANG-S3]KIC54148.1 N-acetylmuramoyl-L-alanine amidase [Leisingera sp. ANG-S]KID11033.1 N-acetylmuramoyl-L-alanine amidase [Leisingera sp. ANG1]